jgi:hypothetical protein
MPTTMKTKKSTKAMRQRRALAKAEQIKLEIESLTTRLDTKRAERDDLIIELIDNYGYSEREVGRLVGVAGPRVNTIYNRDD